MKKNNEYINLLYLVKVRESVKDELKSLAGTRRSERNDIMRRYLFFKITKCVVGSQNLARW